MSLINLERLPKPPLGSLPFHIMERERPVCGLCGMTEQRIVDEAEDFCPVILAANKAAIEAWEASINQASNASGSPLPRPAGRSA